MEIRVKVADFAVGASGATLVTVGLGSCVAIMIYDPVAHVGGMAHVLLPSQVMARDRDNPAKFPGSAVPLLLEHMVPLGASRARLQSKIVGGASMFANLITTGGGGINVGERNVLASREALSAAKIPLVGEDVGRDHGRTVYFDVSTGQVEVRSLKWGNRVL